MAHSIEAVATHLKSAYRIGADHRKKGQPITTKASYLTNNPWDLDHDLLLDMYYAYAKGYRATVPTPLVMGGVR